MVLPGEVGDVSGVLRRGVFLSYRRDDAGPYARSLQLQLNQRIPGAPVFMDLDSIEPGLDFAEVIEDAVNSSAVLVALIGRQWATLTDEDGGRRLDNPDDYVRFELKTALEQSVRVIPVLIDGAKTLRQQELPAELHKLARLNAHKLTYERYQDDADRLLDLIQRVLATVGEEPLAEPERELLDRNGGEKADRQAREGATRPTEEEADTKVLEERADSAMAAGSVAGARNHLARATPLFTDAERIWEKVRRTGQRQAQAFVFQEIPSAGAHPGVPQPALVPEQDYFRVWLCEVFLGTRSTLTADWLPLVHARVAVTRPGWPPLEYSKVLEPEPGHLAQGVQLNYPLTDLIPFKGGVVEVEAALLAWQHAYPIDAVVDLLKMLSTMPIPPAAAALAIATQVTTAVRDLVQKGNGAVHLDLHQSFAASGNEEGRNAEPENALRPSYLAVLLADESQVSPGTLRVVDSQLHQVGDDGQLRHLLGWDFLLLRIEGRATLDDFRLPEVEELLNKAMAALEAGRPTVATNYRSAAIAAAWRSPLLTWTDRDRIIDAIKARFDHVAQRGLGVVPTPAPESLTALVGQYGPDVGEIRARGPMTEASGFAP